MNRLVFPRPPYWLCLTLLCLCTIALAAPPLLAADTGAESAPALHANVLLELVGNRARMIQVSLVCVAFGCALLWWRR